MLRTETGESGRTRLGFVFLRLDAVEDMLGLGQIVDASIIAPTVGGEDEGGDEIEFSVAGCTLGIAGA